MVEVRADRFDPDGPLRFAAASSEAAPLVAKYNEVFEGEELDEDETSSESGEAESSSGEDDEIEVDGHFARGPAKLASATCYMHEVTKKVHYGREGDESRLACGRPRTQAHIEIELLDALAMSEDERCKPCFGYTRKSGE